jgi:hypothetical protein
MDGRRVRYVARRSRSPPAKRKAPRRRDVRLPDSFAMDPASDRACDERSALPPLRWIAEEDLL